MGALHKAMQSATLAPAEDATGAPAGWRAADAHVDGKGACSGAVLGGGAGCACFGTCSTLHNTST